MYKEKKVKLGMSWKNCAINIAGSCVHTVCTCQKKHVRTCRGNEKSAVHLLHVATKILNIQYGKGDSALISSDTNCTAIAICSSYYLFGGSGITPRLRRGGET